MKRCVGMPGQTLRIQNDTIYLDGKPNAEPEFVQYRYNAQFVGYLDDETKRELGITNEELEYVSAGAGFPMTHQVKDELVARGEMNTITNWLKENIHCHASFKKPGALFEEVCGKFDATYYTDYLTKKYTELYNL